MKKSIKFFSLMLSIFAMSVAFTACSDDDDEGPLKDPATVISGNYVGNGVLGVSSLSLENYPGMKVVVTKSSNEYVIVTPYTAKGTPFFASGTGHVFQIMQSANGDFMLSSSEWPAASITVSKSGHMEYSYPYVAVEGEGGYTLSFTGDLQ